MTVSIFDKRVCALGEGPLWHPLRQQLFWFDINGHKLLSQHDGAQLEWDFDEAVSAAGWVDEETLLTASASGLWRFALATGERQLMCPLEASNDKTRSNDGRADPWGGFWIGTMGYNAEPGAGAIYRYYQGTLKKVVPDITISNSICFAPDRSVAYYSDTSTGRIMSVPLDRNGWPDGAAMVFTDLTARGLNPDGAVVSGDGTVWVALWGAARVAGFDKNGVEIGSVALPALHVTCPAFGGADYGTLYVTSATSGLADEQLKHDAKHGMVFKADNIAQGVAEPRVLL